MITLERFRLLEAAVRAAGYDDAIAWSETAGPPTSPEDFASHAIYVIINGGMTNAVAVAIFDRCITALNASGSCKAVYGHTGKSSGIDEIWARRVELYEGYLAANDKVPFCQTLPWIGPVTCFHLAKNFGVRVAKPDVHMRRLAKVEGCTSQELCDRLATETGYRPGTIDMIMWRACADLILRSRTYEKEGWEVAFNPSDERPLERLLRLAKPL